MFGGQFGYIVRRARRAAWSTEGRGARSRARGGANPIRGRRALARGGAARTGGRKSEVGGPASAKATAWQAEVSRPRSEGVGIRVANLPGRVPVPFLSNWSFRFWGETRGEQTDVSAHLNFFVVRFEVGTFGGDTPRYRKTVERRNRTNPPRE
jgi:hypothetical protein